MRIVFMGTPDFAVPCLEALIKDGNDIAAVYTQPDKPRGRGQKLLPSPVKAWAEGHRFLSSQAPPALSISVHM